LSGPARAARRATNGMVSAAKRADDSGRQLALKIPEISKNTSHINRL